MALQLRFQKRRSIQSLTNPYSQQYPDIMISESHDCQTAKLPLSKDIDLKELSFITESEESSAELPEDTEIVKIQKITKALRTGLRGKISSYKKLSQDYNRKRQVLREKVKGYRSELEGVKHEVSSVLNDTSQTYKFVKQLRESVQYREGRVQTEDLATCNTVCDMRIDDAVKKLKDDVEGIRQFIECTEAQFKDEMQTKAEVSEKCTFECGRSQNCKCEIF